MGRADPDRISFGWETCDWVFGQANFRDLLLEHWHELGIYHAVRPLDPDLDAFREGEKEGRFKCWVARTHNGMLVGYIGWWIQPTLHYRSTMHACEDLYLLSAPYRKTGQGLFGSTGMRMWRECLPELKKLGARLCFLHAKVHFNSVRDPDAPRPRYGGQDVFFRRLGFEHCDNVYVLDLGRLA